MDDKSLIRIDFFAIYRGFGQGAIRESPIAQIPVADAISGWQLLHYLNSEHGVGAVCIVHTVDDRIDLDGRHPNGDLNRTLAELGFVSGIRVGLRTPMRDRPPVGGGGPFPPVGLDEWMSYCLSAAASGVVGNLAYDALKGPALAAARRWQGRRRFRSNTLSKEEAASLAAFAAAGKIAISMASLSEESIELRSRRFERPAQWVVRFRVSGLPSNVRIQVLVTEPDLAMCRVEFVETL